MNDGGAAGDRQLAYMDGLRNGGQHRLESLHLVRLDNDLQVWLVP
jgi:hypothetical protein